MDADGQEAKPGEPFDIGDEQAMYPSDPNLSDEQAMGCLCWLEVNGVGDDTTIAQDEGGL